jgi:hypothetical protein
VPVPEWFSPEAVTVEEFTYDLGLGTVPELATVPAENIFQSEHLPEGYTIIVNENGVIIIFDDSGIPLGYYVLAEGETMQDVLENELLLEEMTPFLKVNPRTGAHGDELNLSWLWLLLLTLPMLLKGMLIFKRRRKNA